MLKGALESIRLFVQDDVDFPSKKSFSLSVHEGEQYVKTIFFYDENSGNYVTRSISGGSSSFESDIEDFFLSRMEVSSSHLQNYGSLLQHDNYSSNDSLLLDDSSSDETARSLHASNPLSDNFSYFGSRLSQFLDTLPNGHSSGAPTAGNGSSQPTRPASGSDGSNSNGGGGGGGGAPANQAPTLDSAQADLNTNIGAALNLDISGNFSDPDANPLTYSAQLNGGGALPAWLSFNTSTGIFTGTPANGDAGDITIDVTANDGNGATVTDTFVLSVNRPPTAVGIDGQAIAVSEAFSLDVSGIFTDADADTLTYSIQLNGGGAAPAWMSIDVNTGLITGTPAGGDAGNSSIDVIANDGKGGTVTSTFTLSVTSYAVTGTAGNDNLNGNSVYGDAGDDTIGGTPGDDTLRGGSGSDTFYAQGGHDILYGEDGNDFLYASDGNDTVYGGDGDDHIDGQNDNDLLYGGAGNDNITGNSGDDTIYGGLGNDTIGGDGGNDLIYGNDGNEQAYGSSGNDTMYGGNGDDALSGEADDDILYGDAGQDLLDGGDGNDTIYGGLDNDTLTGAAGHDLLFGGEGDDRINGVGGNDTIYGGAGNDNITLGTGDDRVAFDRALDGEFDTITDFRNSGDDRVWLSDTTFTFASLEGAKTGNALVDDVDIFDVGVNFAGGNFTAGGGATFLYDTTDYQLWYDADGDAGPGTAVLIAVLTDYAAYSASHFEGI